MGPADGLAALVDVYSKEGSGVLNFEFEIEFRQDGISSNHDVVTVYNSISTRAVIDQHCAPESNQRCMSSGIA